ncbi:STAS domain-containing protein [Mangrovihabitans endophyticus]|uniref:STAS domain-containing protein n=1 Tax=Mangrovihabitans endophyticus TaxID=1751298 RepID=A0A8J3FSR0_9ACTN|nr:STAS domain-containing protein [Mangrovihabitans endophyticus]GGL16114.1 hypothetical protein GCM10012284_58450 [Mangrovihabitans endophyticus]
MTGQHFAIDIGEGVDSESEAVTRLRLRGEFDLAAHDTLRAALTDQGSAKIIVIDLAEVSLIDAATVSLLFEARVTATGPGRTLQVVGAFGVVHRVLEILDPSHVLRCGG